VPFSLATPARVILEYSKLAVVWVHFKFGPKWPIMYACRPRLTSHEVLSPSLLSAVLAATTVPPRPSSELGDPGRNCLRLFGLSIHCNTESPIHDRPDRRPATTPPAQPLRRRRARACAIRRRRSRVAASPTCCFNFGLGKLARRHRRGQPQPQTCTHHYQGPWF
jgi:hypothetical protein